MRVISEVTPYEEHAHVLAVGLLQPSRVFPLVWNVRRNRSNGIRVSGSVSVNALSGWLRMWGARMAPSSAIVPLDAFRSHDLRNEIVEERNPIRGTKTAQNWRVNPCGMKEAAEERAKGAKDEEKLGKQVTRCLSERRRSPRRRKRGAEKRGMKPSFTRAREQKLLGYQRA